MTFQCNALLMQSLRCKILKVEEDLIFAPDFLALFRSALLSQRLDLDSRKQWLFKRRLLSRSQADRYCRPLGAGWAENGRDWQRCKGRFASYWESQDEESLTKRKISAGVDANVWRKHPEETSRTRSLDLMFFI